MAYLQCLQRLLCMSAMYIRPSLSAVHFCRILSVHLMFSGSPMLVSHVHKSSIIWLCLQSLIWMSHWSTQPQQYSSCVQDLFCILLLQLLNAAKENHWQTLPTMWCRCPFFFELLVPYPPPIMLL